VHASLAGGRRPMTIDEPPMRLSQRGFDLITHFEGYHTRLPDGRCKAYLDRLAKPHIWTIGWGCTEGVREGMIWTREEAEAAFRRELARHERAVMKAATVDLNQNQFDALVSFSYNCGAHGMARSTALKRLNRGDLEGAAEALKWWNKAGGKVWPGLVRRRAAEAALLLEQVEDAPIHDMPQRPEVNPPDMSPGVAVSTGAAVSGSIAAGGAMIPAPPPEVAATAANVSTWQALGGQAADTLGWAVTKPLEMTLVVGAVVLLGWVMPWLARRQAG